MRYPKTAKRLQEALKENDLSQQELSDKSDVKKASISQYVNGSHKPSNISAAKMGDVLNVNPLWLMGFDSEKESRKTKLAKESPLAKALLNYPNNPLAEDYFNKISTSNLNETQIELIRMICELNEKGIKKVAEYVCDIYEMDKYRK